MHPDEIALDAGLVRELVDRQFPDWSQLPLTFVATGTVNAVFQLGDALTVRLPLTRASADGVAREREWLPRIAPHVGVPIPTVVGSGEPGGEYPCPWLVLDWIAGRCPVPGRLAAPDLLAADLAEFIGELRQIDPRGAPAAARGGPLYALDGAVRECLGEASDLVDVATLVMLWEESLDAAPWAGDPQWCHGDLLSGNMLLRGGRLAGVIDFASAGAGDPACDMMAAWSVLPAASRRLFRRELRVDAEMWLRGRGWALAQAAIALPYYLHSFPVMAQTSLHILRELQDSASAPGDRPAPDGVDQAGPA